jgi:hypothetical protein
MEKNHVICVGRQLGSGGHEIGERLAQGWLLFFDKELIKLASAESASAATFLKGLMKGSIIHV